LALYYDLPVFNDTYRLTLKIFELTKNFSREYKFTLGQDMKRDCISLVRSIYRANKNKERRVYLEQFLDEFEVLKLEIRLCKDLHLITVKQQAQLVLSMDKIGKQITGWRNAATKLASKAKPS
jgi:four helix bundle protein